MVPDEFWSATWLELAARRKVWDRAEMRHAELLAGLHNGALVRKDKKLWEPDHFLYPAQPKPSTPAEWAMEIEAFKALVPPSPEEAQRLLAERTLITGEMEGRMSRAREAQRRGASAAEINSIMGVN